MLPRLVSNFWAQVILLPWLPEVLTLQMSHHAQPDSLHRLHLILLLVLSPARRNVGPIVTKSQEVRFAISPFMSAQALCIPFLGSNKAVPLL